MNLRTHGRARKEGRPKSEVGSALGQGLRTWWWVKRSEKVKFEVATLIASPLPHENFPPWVREGMLVHNVVCGAGFRNLIALENERADTSEAPGRPFRQARSHGTPAGGGGTERAIHRLDLQTHPSLSNTLDAKGNHEVQEGSTGPPSRSFPRCTPPRLSMQGLR